MGEADDFGPLVKLAVEFIKDYSFELLDPLGDRHGSWEVTFHRSPVESRESNGDRALERRVRGGVERPPQGAHAQ